MDEELKGVRILQNELEKSKGRLKEFNESIKKLTGNDHPGGSRRIIGNDYQGSNLRGRRNIGADSQNFNEGMSGRIGRGRGRIFGIAKRGMMEDSGPPVKRRAIGGAFSRLGPAPTQRRVREESPEEDGLPKGLSVHSSVIATSREAKNRQEIMKEQTKDKEGMQRNRRMFGLLLGTLNKFKTDSKTMESKEEQRKKIDQKLEDNAEKERKKFKQDTMQLMEERHLEETRISHLEQKMEVVQEHSEIESEMKKLKHFLCTKTKPRIFWKPREMNCAAENKLKDSVKIVGEMLQASQDRLEKEIKDVMEREQKREERIKMRLREDGLFLDEDEKKESKEGSVGKAGDVGSASESNSLQKLKLKRRVIVEDQRDEDSDSESENPAIEKEDIDLKREIEKEEEDGEVEEEAETEKTTGKATEEDDTGESSSESENKKDNDKNAKISLHNEVEDKGGKTKTGKNDKSDDGANATRDQEVGNSRVVEYRTNSRDKERSSQEKSGRDVKKDDKSESSSHDRYRDERHSHKEEKRSHRHSKRSHKDSEKAIGKEEKVKKKHKSDRIVVEES